MPGYWRGLWNELLDKFLGKKVDGFKLAIPKKYSSLKFEGKDMRGLRHIR